MAGLAARFTKNLNGDSEIDYANFDNPVYEMDNTGQPNFDAPNIPPHRGTTLDSLFGSKGDDRRKRMIVGGAVILLVLAIIIVAAAVGATVAKKNKGQEAVSAHSVATPGGASTSFVGSMRLTDKVFLDVYNNPETAEYQLLKQEFEESMDNMMISEKMDGKYSKTIVLGFSPGSIIVVYRITFVDTPAITPQQLNDAIVSQINQDGGRFGKFDVDVSSISLAEGSLPPTAKPTTKASTSKPNSSGRPTTTQKTTMRAVTTVRPVSTCGHPIIAECASVLTYNSSKRSLEQQNLMKHSLLQLANHTSDCYNQSVFYMCTIIAPHCYGSPNNTEDDVFTEFLLPCQQLCLDYSDQCKEQLAGVETNGALNCNAYLPHVPEYPGRCAYTGTPPPALVTTTISPNETRSEMCYPIHHTYCANVPWKSAYLPNYMGHTSLSQAYDFLSFMQALQDSGMHCHDGLHTLVCGTVLPKCGDDGSRVPPCESLCLDVLSNCTLMLSNLPIHVPISCSIFTENTDCTDVGAPLPSSECNSTTQYTCLDGQQCIDLGERCNGFPNCGDGSDESGCGNVTSCFPGEFRCTITGACIPDTWRCDAYNDCGDGTDERGCECTADEFRCTASDGTRRCINGSQQCDGYYNCYGRQDEMNCANFTCRPDQHTCDNGLCRPLRFVCDGDDDCGDLSDEKNCLVNEVCLESEYKCVNGSRQWGIGYTSCIPNTWQCDTERDCSDGSDEKGCPSLCFPNPCSHNGTCRADVRGYLCDCPAGTGGSNCQIVENLPEVSCNTEIIIDVCKTALEDYHTTTIATNFSQSQVAPYVVAGIQKLGSCYEYTPQFLCQYVVPECGSLAFPKFPCKSMCLEFKAQCAHKLNETEAIDRLIDCDSLLDDHVFPDMECFKLNHTSPTVAPPPAAELGCQELKVEYCQDLGYNTTFLPNLLNHTHQSTAEWLVDQFEYAHSNMPTCNPYLKHFGCAISVPACNANGTAGIPPCKDLCEAVAFDCGYWMDHMQWRFPFSCDHFPVSNDSNVCVQLPPPVPKVGCYGDQFECGSGECIHKTFQCDTFPDCDDESDEEQSMCETFGCRLSEFDCGDSYCIPKSWQCDTDYDCPQAAGSQGPSADEIDCTCDVDERVCANGAGCYPNNYHCDGLNDCVDQSDESDASCGNFTRCGPYAFECGSGECILQLWKCDNVHDCMDGSDELNCDIQCGEQAVLCANGTNWYTGSACVPTDWLCDDEEDCTDGSDEVGCHPCSSNPCKHGGTCIEEIAEDSDLKYVCECPEATSGVNCEELVGLSSVQCNSAIEISHCLDSLAPHYNTTRTSSVIQMIYGMIISEDILNRFDECAPNYGPLVICSSLVPGCQSNGLPIIPCKHICTSFAHSCQDLLNATNLVVDCSFYPDKAVYPDTICIASPDDVAVPPPTAPLNQPQCETMKHQFCGQLYNETIIPNLIGQSSQAEATIYVEIIEKIHSDYPLCHDALRLFACSVLAPECRDGSTVPQLPCQQLCLEVKNNCSYELAILEMPLQLDCESMPIYNGNPNAPNCVINVTQIPGCAPDTYTCASGACVPSTARCDGVVDCPDASDELGCAPGLCDDDEYLCSTHAFCIPREWKCDGQNDCPGAEDESQCDTVCSAARNEFQCSDNVTCLSWTHVCDYVTDCPDGGDELNCDSRTCASNQFQCNSGRCIPEQWECDTATDCPGNAAEDEQDCAENTCPPQFFRCSDGGVNVYIPITSCILEDWVCDNEVDCSDGTDELFCDGGSITVCPSSPCLNGASCELINEVPTCRCEFGYTGQFCETQLLPDYSCQYTLNSASSCNQYLPYTLTSSSTHIQTLMNSSTESLLHALSVSQCYDLAQMFICATAYPSCQENGFPLFPCRHVCHEFMSRCNHVDIVSQLGHINCDAFVDQSNPTFTCLNNNTLPPPKVPTNVPVEYRCELMNNTVCSFMSYTSVSLPNHFGQTSQSEAAYLTNLLSSLDSSSLCHQHMTFVGCALTFPKCAADNQPLPPCRADCRAALEKCEYFFDHYQLTLPVDCNSFPDSEDPTVCLQMQTATSPNKPCAEGTRLCTHSGQCLPEDVWCDTEVDCFDASDEEHCEMAECTAPSVRCEDSYTHCIPDHWLCDGFSDCSTGSDERDCEVNCDHDEFTCLTGSITGNLCIPNVWVCDGEVDCLGDAREDEADCVCTDNQFTCEGNHMCIPQRWVCDFIRDCDDGSDERDCPSTTWQWWWTTSPYQ